MKRKGEKENQNWLEKEEPEFKKPLRTEQTIPTDVLDAETIDKLLNEAPPTEELDVSTVKRMILSLEKKINQNQLQRVKFSDKPEKFMESEVELDEEIKKLHILATSPTLYPELVRLNTIPSLLSLLSHENVDISVDIVDLLNELTESDILVECKEAVTFIESLLDNEILELLVQNLSRFDEHNNDESQAVHNTLGIFENLIELKPDVVELITSKTSLLEWILNRIKEPEYDDNKLYASEILAILVQGSKENQIKFGNLNGNDSLLIALSAYRKRDPQLIEEEEMAENFFDCICSGLQIPENQEAFINSEGIELMIMMIKSKKFCRKSALKVLDYALVNSPRACKQFVDSLGLKTLFSAFMKKGSKKNKKGFDEKKDDEHIMSCIVSLLKNLSGNHLDRTIAKFTESDFEKVERLIELHEKYINLVKVSDKHIEERKQELDETEINEEDIQEEFLLMRLDAGLFTLQLVDTTIAFVCCDENIKSCFMELLNLRGKDIKEIINILEEHANNYGETDSKVHEKDVQFIKNLVERLKKDEMK